MQIPRLLSFFVAVNLTFVLGMPWTSYKRKTDDISNCEFHSLPIPLYRAFNLQSEDNVFTTSVSSLESQLQVPGFEGDGIVGSVLAAYETGLLPLFRLFNQDFTDHFYTSEASERHSFEQAGYELQEFIGYVLPDSMCGSVPLLRFKHEQTGRHFFTLSENDLSAVVLSGFTYEGVVGYILPSLSFK